jgi:sugar/nucleoside kinase (ribokinase family)
MLKKMDVLVVGELNVDLILSGLDSPPEINKEKIANQMELTLGSSSAIFASNISSLGLKVSFCGKIGADSFGETVISSLEKKKVDTFNIIRDPKIPTGATIIMNYEENRYMVTYPGAMNLFNIHDIPIELFHQTRHLHFSSYFLQPGMRSGLGQLMKMAKQAGLTTSLDLQWDPQEKWDFDYENILPFVDVFLPNEAEILALSKKPEVIPALEKLGRYGNIVVAKCGSKGAIAYNKGLLIEKPAYLNTKVVDTVGAGDSFNAGFIFRFLQNASMKECLNFGNLTGAISTTAPGGTNAFKTIEDTMKIAEERFNFKQ